MNYIYYLFRHCEGEARSNRYSGLLRYDRNDVAQLF